MTWAIRTFALTAGAAALVSAQAAYAAPVRSTAAVDPLVAVSLFGTAQSRAAVCAAGAPCALPSYGATASTSAPMLGAAAVATQNQRDRRDRPNNQLLLLAGVIALMVAIGVGAALLGGDDDGPISPE
jgi:hypothetical protein